MLNTASINLTTAHFRPTSTQRAHSPSSYVHPCYKLPLTLPAVPSAELIVDHYPQLSQVCDILYAIYCINLGFDRAALK